MDGQRPRQFGRRATVIASLALFAAVSCATTAHAGSPADQSSAHRAVLAWSSLVRDQVKARHLARLRLSEYRRSITTGCPHTLDAFASESPDKLNWQVVRDLLGEVGYGAELVGARPMRPAIRRFSRRLQTLTWSSDALRKAVSRDARHALESLAGLPPDVCATAVSVAADPTRTPASARRFLAQADGKHPEALWTLADRLERVAAPTDRKRLRRLFRRTDLAFGESLVTSIAKTDERIKTTLGLKRLERTLFADSNAKSDARNLVSLVESCYADTDDYRDCRKPGVFGGLSVGSGPGQAEVSEAGKHTYSVVAHSPTGNDFTITKTARGILSRTCTRAGVAYCPSDERW